MDLLRKIITSDAFKAIAPALLIGGLVGAQQYSDAITVFVACLFWFILKSKH